MYRQAAIDILHRASELVAQGDYLASGIAALLGIYSPMSHMNYFAGPLLSFSPHHYYPPFSFLPDWLIQLVHLRRLDLITAETQNGHIGDLAVAADIMAFFYLINEAGDLPREWRPLYEWAAQEAMKPGSLILRWGDGLKLRKNLRTEIERLSIRADIASIPWHNKPLNPLSSFPLGDTSLQQLGLVQLKPEWRVAAWEH